MEAQTPVRVKAKIQNKKFVEETESSLNIQDQEVDELENKFSDTKIDEIAEDVKAEKRMTNKELKKKEEYEKQQAALLKKGGQGASDLDSKFTITQATKPEDRRRHNSTQSTLKSRTSPSLQTATNCS